MRIVLVREHGAFRVQYEAGRLHLLANGCRLNPMQRLGVARARPDGGGVVYDDVGPTGLQPLVDRRLWKCRSFIKLVVDTELLHIRDGAGRYVPNAGNNSEG